MMPEIQLSCSHQHIADGPSSKRMDYEPYRIPHRQRIFDGNCSHPLNFLSLSELPMTVTELTAIAAAASTGFRKPCSPNTGLSESGQRAE